MFADRVNAFFSDWPRAVLQQTTGGGWRFDFISFTIGVVVALLLVGLAYRHRGQILTYRNKAREKANRLSQRLTANVATRYSVSAVETAQTMHLFGALTSLDNIYVETQLAPVAPPEDATERFSLSPSRAIQTSNRLFIIGRPGSGRTTLLYQLLLLQAGQLHATGEGEHVPVYIYLPALAIELSDLATAAAATSMGDTPSLALVRTALSPFPRLTATGVSRWLRRQVEAGNALVLLDGWDEIPSTDRPVVTRWIQELSTTHRQNRLVITAGERGYAPLVEAGFVPLRLSPWTHRQLSKLTQRWTAAWPSKDNGPYEQRPSISYRLTPPTPLQATIELVIRLAGQEPASTPAEKMAQVMGLLLPQPGTDGKGHEMWPLDTGHRALERLTLSALEQGRSILIREEIQSAVTEAMPPPQFALDTEQEEDTNKKELKAAREEQERRTLQIVDCCRALTATGAPIRAWGNRHYYFNHPLVAAYLAARHLIAEEITPVAYIDDPARLDVLRFYVGMAPAKPLIEHLLSTPDDLFLNNLWRAATLLAATPPGDEPWRIGLIKRLARIFMDSRLPDLLQDRSLEALINSREAGVSLLFKQAASSPDPRLHARAILGLGALGREQDLPLIEAALGAANPNVLLAAIDALRILARMGSEPAMELIIASVIEAEDQVQRAAAEALADLGSEGHAVLRDAAQDHDLIVRRAAVFGLAAVEEPWARELLEKTQWEDQEWLVRNAAAEALNSLSVEESEGAPTIDLTLSQIGTEPWLITWAAERGEGVGTGEGALAALISALTEGDAPVRQKAIESLRRLADPQAIDPLRKALRDPEPSIRQAALVALDEISRRHDMVITTS